MIYSWAIVAAWIVFVILANRKVHPKVLFALFMVELWERFSYYGMRAFLVLYLTKEIFDGFGMSKDAAYGFYGAYGALVYLTPLLGGMLADKFMGFRKAIIWGALLMAAGQFTLASSADNILLEQVGAPKNMVLFVGLALLTIGNGFFKPNISSMIGKFYGQGDPRRDGAFTIFYMGINLGAFLAPVTCGAVAEIEGWKYGFMLAGCGMIIGLLFFYLTVWAGWLEDKSDPPAGADKIMIGPLPIGAAIRLGTFLLVPIAALLVYKNNAMDILLAIVGIGMIGYMIWLSVQYDKIEGQRIWVIVVLLLFTTVFWTFFELAGSALNVFTEENVEKTIFGEKLTTTFFQAVNPAFIMLFAPVFSALWLYLAKRRIDPPAPVKFSMGLALLGAGFLMLNLGKPFVNNAMMPAIFLILFYLLATLGELVLSPVGLSLVTKLAPARIVGFVMGFWFLSSAIAHQAGKWIAKATTTQDPNVKLSPQQSLDLSLSVFTNVGFFALGSALLLLILSPILKKWMHGVENVTTTANAEQEPPMVE